MELDRGFNDVTSVPSSGTYYQLWENGVGTVNTGANGLEVFDYVVSSAQAHNIKLIVALSVFFFGFGYMIVFLIYCRTNNWNNYGGMDVYVNEIAGSSGG